MLASVIGSRLARASSEAVLRFGWLGRAVAANQRWRCAARERASSACRPGGSNAQTDERRGSAGEQMSGRGDDGHGGCWRREGRTRREALWNWLRQPREPAAAPSEICERLCPAMSLLPFAPVAQRLHQGRSYASPHACSCHLLRTSHPTASCQRLYLTRSA